MRAKNERLKFTFLHNINPVVRFLIISDTIFMGGMGLLGPIFALYINDFIIGGNEAVAGVAAAIYLFTKSGLQVPVAYMIDRIKGETDDFWVVFLFTVIISIMPIAYLFIDTPLELYIVQFIIGILTAFTFPSFMALFTRHIDKKKEGTEWGAYYSMTDLTSAGFAAVGGYLAMSQGFNVLIIVVVIVSLSGALLLWPIRSHLKFK